MASRPRSRKKRGWPDGLYERNGYFSWRNPLTGVEMGIGRVPENDAKAQAAEANVEVAGLRNKPRLVDRLLGKTDNSFGAYIAEYEKKLGLVASAEHDPRTLAGNTLKSYRSIVKKIRTVFKDSLGLPIDKVTTKIIADGLKPLRKSMARTAQAMRSRLFDLFECAIADGWTTNNPVTVTDDVEVKVKRARLTWDVFKAAYDREKVPSTRNAMALALVSGQPREVIAAAMFTEVGNVERPGEQPVECWKVTRGKTGAMIAIPLDLRLNALGLSLREVIAQCRATKVVSRYMVHNSTRRKGSKLGDPIALNRLTRDVSAAIEAVGIDWGDLNPPTLHEIRSLSKRLYKAQGGVDTKDLLGHTTDRMGDLYADARGAEYKLVKIA
jgi:hypothetical protein